MIAAIVLLALVASTQAFPGSSEVQANKGPVDTACVYNYYQKFTELFRSTKTGSTIVAVVEYCTADVNPDSWISSAWCLYLAGRVTLTADAVLKDVMAVYPTVIEYASNFVGECFTH